MKTKSKIVEKLLEKGHITAEEAVILLEKEYLINPYPPQPSPPYNGGLVPYHTICGCNICNCIMANRMVDPKNFGNGNWTTTFTTNLEDKE